MTKRARLDDDSRRVRELELELELARLCRQDEQDYDGGSGEVSAAGGDGTNQPDPPPAPQSGTSSAPAAASQTTDDPTPSTAQPTSWGHSRGRGPRSAQGGRFASLDNRGLQTVFVCIACDKIYCQSCNAYKKSLDYWNRQ